MASMQLTGHDASRNLLPPDWRSVIHSAATEEELVSITRDYLACWSPEEIARLPVECRPGRVRDGEDIAQWAFELTSCHLARRVPAEDEPLLLKMMLFVNEAAERLAKLQAARRTAEATD
jgi:hypothetical protein